MKERGTQLDPNLKIQNQQNKKDKRRKKKRTFKFTLINKINFPDASALINFKFYKIKTNLLK